MSDSKTFQVIMHPDADKPWLFNFSGFLDEENDKILSSTIDVPTLPAGLAQHDKTDIDVNIDGKLFENAGVLVWFKTTNPDDAQWDSPGIEYKITCVITTVGGLIEPMVGILTVCRP